MDMVERVARALYAIRMDVAENVGLHEPYVWETDNNAYREHCLKEARAAIEAMREPTPEMVNLRQSYRFVENDGEGGAWIDEEGATAFWQAMIDKALTP